MISEERGQGRRGVVVGLWPSCTCRWRCTSACTTLHTRARARKRGSWHRARALGLGTSAAPAPERAPEALANKGQ